MQVVLLPSVAAQLRCAGVTSARSKALLILNAGGEGVAGPFRQCIVCQGAMYKPTPPYRKQPTDSDGGEWPAAAAT